MKVREIVKLIEKNGWVLIPRTGTSHRQYVHPSKPGRVTIAGHPGDDIPIGTKNNILKQAGLK
jgi:predicted RNA binding protein YcfA (HicA-like mRNA interferase family)